MEDNKILNDIIGKIPQAKETVEKIENATGKKIENIAGEIGGKIVDAIKENGQEDPKNVFNNMKDKLLFK